MKHVVAPEVQSGNWRTCDVRRSWTKFKIPETLIVKNIRKKDKTVRAQTWTGCKGSRLPDFKTVGTLR
jgi:hypothetical protein